MSAPVKHFFGRTWSRWHILRGAPFLSRGGQWMVFAPSPTQGPLVIVFFFSRSGTVPRPMASSFPSSTAQSMITTPKNSPLKEERECPNFNYFYSILLGFQPRNHPRWVVRVACPAAETELRPSLPHSPHPLAAHNPVLHAERRVGGPMAYFLAIPSPPAASPQVKYLLPPFRAPCAPPREPGRPSKPIKNAQHRSSPPVFRNMVPAAAGCPLPTPSNAPVPR